MNEAGGTDLVELSQGNMQRWRVSNVVLLPAGDQMDHAIAPIRSKGQENCQDDGHLNQMK